jgi:predicted component of type VI protein secretion system
MSEEFSTYKRLKAVREKFHEYIEQGLDREEYTDEQQEMLKRAVDDFTTAFNQDFAQPLEEHLKEMKEELRKEITSHKHLDGDVVEKMR